MSEKPRFADPKRLCGIFGDQLIRGEVNLVFQHQIRSKDRSEKINGLFRGMWDPLKREIHALRSDPLEEQVITVFHELFHDNYSDVDEETIQAEAVKLYESLSPRQLRFFEFMITPEIPHQRTVVSTRSSSRNNKNSI